MLFIVRTTTHIPAYSFTWTINVAVKCLSSYLGAIVDTVFEQHVAKFITDCAEQQ